MVDYNDQLHRFVLDKSELSDYATVTVRTHDDFIVLTHSTRVRTHGSQD